MRCGLLLLPVNRDYAECCGQTDMIGCFSNLSLFRALRGITIHMKGKTGKILHENATFLEQLPIF